MNYFVRFLLFIGLLLNSSVAGGAQTSQTDRPEPVPDLFEQLAEPVVKPDTEPVVKPVVKPDTEPVVKPDTEPVVKPDTEPVVKPDKKNTTEPVDKKNTTEPPEPDTTGLPPEEVEKLKMDFYSSSAGTLQQIGLLISYLLINNNVLR